MSNLPPQPPSLPSEPLTYAAPPQDFRNGMAVAALVLGILGLVACPIFAPLGIIFGIIGLLRANSTAPVYKGRGLSIAGICCGGAGLLIMPALMISILLPSLSRAREITKRAVCGSNLRCIGQGLKVYANENDDWYPCTLFPNPTETASNVEFIGYLSEAMTLPVDEMPLGTAKQHPSRALFMLVTDMTCDPSMFVCLSSPDVGDELINNVNGRDIVALAGRDRFDFRGYDHLSYGYQCPYGFHGRPSDRLDARMAVVADKGPYFLPGNRIGGERTPDAAAGTPGAPITFQNAASAEQLLATDKHDWEPYNSRNHGSEGQNVLYQDGHVAFKNKPLAGVNFDNIYTRKSDHTQLGSLLGLRPADRSGPLGNTDSVIIP